MKYQDVPDSEYIEDQNKKTNIVSITIVACFFFMLFIGIIGVFLTSCTLSFQNVMTDGTASDVVDSEPKSDVPVTTNLTIPFKPL